MKSDTLTALVVSACIGMGGVLAYYASLDKCLHCLTDELYNALVLHASAEKCGFNVNKPVFADWMGNGTKTPAELVPKLNTRLIEYYEPLVEEISPAQCIEWQRLADSRDALLPDNRNSVVTVRQQNQRRFLDDSVTA